MAGASRRTDEGLLIPPITLSPAAANVSVGDSVQLAATLKDTAGNVLSGRSVLWASSDWGVATVSASGLVTGAAVGAPTITATSEGLRGTVSITVANVPVASVEVSPAIASVWVAGTMQLRATPKDAAGNVLAGRAVTWTSSNAGIAPVSASGLVTGAAAGAATITATSEGQSAPVAITVATAPVASVSVSPSSADLPVGQTVQLTATLQDAAGNVLSGRTVLWASSAWGVATVSAGGLATGSAAGTATITATSEGVRGTALVSVTGAGAGGGPGQVTYYNTNFNDGTTGLLDVNAYGGGGCARSTDFQDRGSAFSMKCTIPVGTGGAALQAWFGNGRLSGTPLDPSLDQDLFQETRFVLAPGAAAAIGGLTCWAPGSTPPQFKTHKATYGVSGSNVNGWAMSQVGPCQGPPGMFTSPEMWSAPGGINYAWPGTYPSLGEGSVYDVVYRYHRYTAQGCGTMAVWLSGTQVEDTPCLSYMGTTNGSTAGLVLRDGALYLQAGVGPLTVYTLFTQATNYPIGGATASP